MSRINILDKDIYNLISAGEVVERPCSVVKELIENSIDAKATKIIVEISNGGISKIKVTDNGVGLDKEDLPKAFLPHSTSKISNVSDLDNIATFGFRGEALCSIATVARTSLISKTKNAEGNKIIINGGEIVEIAPVGCVDGTTITVEDLFYNVPARAKFLKKPKLEECEITNYISRLILSNPSISIKYIADGKLIYHSTGSGLYEAIYSIYGKSIVDNLIEVNNTFEDVTVTGYIGIPTFSKPNRTYQTLSVNNRYVLNQQLSVAIGKAYENFLMKGQFPFYVLNLQIPFDSVDVNVHPNKLEVRFEDSSKMFSFLLNSISDKLYNLISVKQISTPNNNEKLINNLSKIDENIGIMFSGFDKNHIENDNNTYNNVINIVENVKKIDIYDENITVPQEVVISDNISEKQKDNEFNNLLYENKRSLASFLVNDKITQVKTDNGFAHEMAYQLTERQIAEKNEQQILNSTIFNDDIKIIGTLFNTYILLEKGLSLYIVDQHAGHERILFDKFMAEKNATTLSSQILLIPYILELSNSDYSFIKSNLENLQNLGFELEEFGRNTFKVNTIPMLLKDISLKQFFDLILKDASTEQFTSKNTEFIYNYIAKCACKSAVKANDILSKNEIETLISMLKTTKVLLCPHGRPIIVEVTIKEIEKWFKRIV